MTTFRFKSLAAVFVIMLAFGGSASGATVRRDSDSGCAVVIEDGDRNLRGKSLFGYTTKGERWDVDVSEEFATTGKLRSQYDNCHDVYLGSGVPVKMLTGGWVFDGGINGYLGKGKLTKNGRSVTEGYPISGSNWGAFLALHKTVHISAWAMLGVGVGYMHTGSGNSDDVQITTRPISASAPFLEASAVIPSPMRYGWQVTVLGKYYMVNSSEYWRVTGPNLDKKTEKTKLKAASPLRDGGVRIGNKSELLEWFLGAGLRSERWKAVDSAAFDSIDNSGPYWEVGVSSTHW